MLPAEFSEEPLAPDETYALVEDPTPLVRAPADPEPPEPIESALPVIEPALTPPESPVKAPEALVPASEPTVAPAELGSGERVMDRALLHLYQMQGKLPQDKK